MILDCTKDSFTTLQDHRAILTNHTLNPSLFFRKFASICRATYNKQTVCHDFSVTRDDRAHVLSKKLELLRTYLFIIVTHVYSIDEVRYSKVINTDHTRVVDVSREHASPTSGVRHNAIMFWYTLYRRISCVSLTVIDNTDSVQLRIIHAWRCYMHHSVSKILVAVYRVYIPNLLIFILIINNLAAAHRSFFTEC